MAKPLVAIFLGSDSDLPVMAETAVILEKAGVSYEFVIASAHRSISFVQQRVKELEAEGVKIFIAAAGMAAALPGVISAETTLPVIGVPLDGSSLKGIDALYAIVQMPGGIPVATMAIGKAGAVNAAVFAVQILALSEEKYRAWMTHHKKKLAEVIMAKSQSLKAKGYRKYIEEMGKK